MINETRKFFECDCHAEGLCIEMWEDKDATTIDISMWSVGYNPGSLDLWNRIRYCWKIITTGRPYADEVSMKPQEALRLGKYLVEIATDKGLQHP